MEGAINALSNLVVSPELQNGFKLLRDRDQLSQTFEALIVQFPELFDANVVKAAEWRLASAHELGSP